MQRYNIFLYYNTFLYFFSTIIHKFRFLYHISYNEQNKDKIGNKYRARARSYICADSVPPPVKKKDKILFKIGLVLKGIKICT